MARIATTSSSTGPNSLAGVKRVRWFAVSAACCALLGACANDAPGAAEADPPAELKASPPPPPSPSPDSSEPGAHPAPPAETVTVIAADNRFDPQETEVAPGTEVVWVNRGRNDHDLISDSGLEFGAVAADFKPGDEYRFVFTEPGEYPYHCTIHGTPEIGMIGTIVVTEPA
jgi:plastocyanin